ncbi:galactose-binding lectin [Rhyzopertha dominica]|nr:galactose-binding lectin [Rhyzopertha dominica]
MSLIRNPASQLYLGDFPGQGLTINSRRQESRYQDWSLEPQGDGSYIIRNVGSGKVLDVEGGGVPAPTTSVITFPEHANNNQRWFIERDDTIATSSNRNLVLDVDQGNLREGANLIVYTKHGGENQIFEVIPQSNTNMPPLLPCCRR